MRLRDSGRFIIGGLSDTRFFLIFFHSLAHQPYPFICGSLIRTQAPQLLPRTHSHFSAWLPCSFNFFLLSERVRKRTLHSPSFCVCVCSARRSLHLALPVTAPTLVPLLPLLLLLPTHTTAGFIRGNVRHLERLLTSTYRLHHPHHHRSHVRSRQRHHYTTAARLHPHNIATCTRDAPSSRPSRPKSTFAISNCIVKAWSTTDPSSSSRRAEINPSYSPSSGANAMAFSPT